MKIKSKNGAFLRFHTVIECLTRKPFLYRNLIDSANLFLQKRGQRKTSFEKFASLKKKSKAFYSFTTFRTFKRRKIRTHARILKWYIPRKKQQGVEIKSRKF